LGEGGFEIERKERREGVREMKGSRVKQGRWMILGWYLKIWGIVWRMWFFRLKWKV
jgi:hypothetical protein